MSQQLFILSFGLIYARHLIIVESNNITNFILVHFNDSLFVIISQGSVTDGDGDGIMQQATKIGYAKLRLLAVMVSVAALASCAEGNYPSLGNITKISDASIMTPEQREAAVKELEKERESQSDRAAKKE